VDVMGRKLAFNMASAVSMNSAFARPSRFATLFAARKFSAEITSKFVPVCVIATMERDLLMFRNIRVEPYVPRTLTNQVIVEAGREQEFASSCDFSTRCLTRSNSNNSPRRLRWATEPAIVSFCAAKMVSAVPDSCETVRDTMGPHSSRLIAV